MARLQRSREAREDLIDIWSYIADDDPHAADRVLDRFNRVFARIARTPRIGRSRPELSPGLRSFPVRDFIVFYRVKDRTVEIVRVLSGFRDLPRLLKP